MKEQVMRRTMLAAAVAWVCAMGTLLQSSTVSRPTAVTTVVADRDPIATRVLPAAAVTPSRSSAQAPATAPPSVATDGAVLSKYCVTCHNDRLKTGGFVLDVPSLGNVGAAADTWERVVRKLRANAMPPAGAPRPDAATYAALTSHIESELDRAADTRPQVGTVPLVHRLSRTEYRNAIRDLLALESLPREVSIDYLLPQDNISSGFDNIADLLFVSPSTMERYLDAARKISRLAVGDPSMPALVNIYRLDPEHPQDERVDELPFGTRGGLAVRSDFPVDATYTVKVELAGNPGERQDLDVTVDGERAALRSVGNTGGGGGRRGRGAPTAPLEFSIPVKAGPHLIGVSFVQRTEARDEATLRPRMRSRGTQPAVGTVTISGPYDVTGPGTSPSRDRIFVCRPAGAGDELPCARRILSTLVRRAYRRPATDADLADLMPFYTEGRGEGSFDLGIQKALERVLVSAQFLFRIERQPATAAPGSLFQVSDLELASRLSFLLWSSIPDDGLLEAAAAGKLKEPAVLEAQVRRMLADPRSETLVTNFAAQWLYLRDIDAKLPDEILFPDFDETLRAAMRRETELFIDSVFRAPRSVMDLLDADYTFLNERLARHYGIPNVRGSYFRRVTLPDGSARGGLLGQGSFLTITSYSTRTSPVLRGKWVLENLLSSAPPPPPPNVPSLEVKGTEPEKPPTLREAMVRHRAAPACAGCHARMDPIGFAMENFDAVGKWRDHEGGRPIDTTGVFPDGSSFTGIDGLKRELIGQPEQFVRTVTEKLLMYAIGRNLQYYDAPTVRRIVRDAAPARYTFSALVMGVVKSRAFQMRQAV
jgi:mono/diheme cytochrome c family protein